MDFKINVPSIVNSIIETLYIKGYEAFIVGGCVRDSLLKTEPNDWDMCSSAKPNEIIEVFKEDYKIIETGLKHGTVTLIDKDNNPYEITTYRIDGEYENNRKPKEVEFTSSLKEDLSRRDFTINAMAYNNKVGLVDYFNGIGDLENKIIRCVGNAEERFKEDALRIMRAYRFMAKLHRFKIDNDIIISSKNLAYLLENISVERIREEFNKILVNNVEVIGLLKSQGILDYIIPEAKVMYNCGQINPYHIMDVWEHTMEAMRNSNNKLAIRLAVLLHDIGKPTCKTTDEEGIDHFYGHPKVSKDISKNILKRLKYDNKTIDKVLSLIEFHDCRLNSPKNTKKILNKIGIEDFKDLLEVRYADVKGKNPIYINQGLENLENTKKEFQSIIDNEECFKVSDLKINGKDLIVLGVKPGKDIGIILDALLNMVIENSSLNTREKLLEILNKNL